MFPFYEKNERDQKLMTLILDFCPTGCNFAVHTEILHNATIKIEAIKNIHAVFKNFIIKCVMYTDM